MYPTFVERMCRKAHKHPMHMPAFINTDLPASVLNISLSEQKSVPASPSLSLSIQHHAGNK